MIDHLKISRELLPESSYVPTCQDLVELLIDFLTSDEGKESNYTIILGNYKKTYAEGMSMLHLAIPENPDFNFSCIAPIDEIERTHDVIREALSELEDVTESRPVLH